MKRRSWFVLVGLSLCATFATWAAERLQDGAQVPADLVLTNGKIITVDARDSIAQAVAVREGKIVVVGTNEEVGAAVGPRTRVIDLRGRTATPGLIDSHAHFQAVGTLYTVNLADSSIRSIDNVLARVRDQVAQRKPGEWVRGWGWDEGKLAERRAIYASDLDQVAPDNPVWLTHTSGHYGVANSYALRLARVTKDTKDPPAGTIDRDADGVPTGVMKESAVTLVTGLIPPFTKEQERAGLLRIIADFNKEGMTGVKDPGIDREKWDLYRELLDGGKLSVRVFALWSGGTTLDSAREALTHIEANPRLPASLGDGRLLSGGVKLFMDGASTARTAWLYQDWYKNAGEKDEGNVGYPAIDPAVYREMVRLLHDAGVHVSTHAIGDRAIDWVVDTYDEFLKAKPTRGLRHGLIHGHIPTEHAIEVLARLQKDHDAGYPEPSATFMWWIGDNVARVLGPERALRMKPFGTYLRKGILWAGGSDHSVTPFPARYGIWASVARETSSGQTPFGFEESASVQAALRSFTIWGARQMFLEDRTGSIEVGKDADMAVWDRDLYTVPAGELKDLKCELTLLRGEIVYQVQGAL